jgi:hypothetical protein
MVHGVTSSTAIIDNKVASPSLSCNTSLLTNSTNARALYLRLYIGSMKISLPHKTLLRGARGALCFASRGGRILKVDE